MNGLKRLSLFAPYTCLILFGLAYAVNLPTQLLVNRYLEALYTGSERGLLMNLYQVGTGLYGMVIASLITTLAYLLPIIDPAIMLNAATTHFGSYGGMFVYLMGLFLSSVMLWQIGRSIYILFHHYIKLPGAVQNARYAQTIALMVPIGALGIYIWYGWFGIVPLTFGLFKKPKR